MILEEVTSRERKWQVPSPGLQNLQKVEDHQRPHQFHFKDVIISDLSDNYMSPSCKHPIYIYVCVRVCVCRMWASQSDIV